MYGQDDGLAPVGDSIDPPNATVLSLERSVYPVFEDAERRLQELLVLRQVRVIGTPFHTARCWSWRVVPC